MKQLLLFVLVVTGLSTARAGHNTSELCLTLDNNAPFMVSLDGANFFQPLHAYSFPNLNAGSHQLKVWKVIPGSWHCAPVKQLVFNGCISLPAGKRVDASITCYGTYFVNSMSPLFPPPVPVCCAWHGQYGGACQSNGWNDDDYEDHMGGGYGNYGGYKMPMSPQSFQGLKQTIMNQSFDQSKLSVARQALMGNYLSSAQVSEIMDLMTFENTKLEFAKSAYGKTVDQNNYFLVNNSFTFKSSVDELNEYIY